jgi:hypothetical protein
MSVPQIRDVADLLPPTCSLCERDAARCAPVGPILIHIEDPESIDAGAIEKIFCTWECAADWFQIQAGRVSPDHGKCYRKYGGNC